MDELNNKNTITPPEAPTPEEQNTAVPAEVVNEPAEPAENEVIEDYSGMPKWKAALLKCLPMIIVLVCTGLFMWGIKAVIGIFYAPHDEVFTKENGGEKYVVVQCTQTPSTYYYVYNEDFVFNEEEYDNVAGEHNDAHLHKVPEVYFVLNESAPDMENVTVKLLLEGNGLKVFQFGEFILYRLEGQYGVFAPLREYTDSATSRKNDLYVVRQLMKNNDHEKFEPPYELDQDFLSILERLEWHLDTQYIEDN
ncbi:MAG: hypothetical protein ACI4WS_09140 [Oscillospiraceae bacterium]